MTSDNYIVSPLQPKALHIETDSAEKQKGVRFVHPEMALYTDRLKSFELWSPQILPSREDLARAGFFYTGRSDVVRCFGCDIAVWRWEKSDNPWAEHLKWSQECDFLQMLGYDAEKKEKRGEKIDPTSQLALCEPAQPKAFTTPGFQFQLKPGMLLGYDAGKSSVSSNKF